MNDPGTFLTVTVTPNYVSTYAGQSIIPSLTQGTNTPASVYLEYTNAGSSAWYDDSSISTAPAGNYPIHLATSHPINRGSGFASGWPTPNRAAANFSAVYESDGVTPAANQHVVQPGEIAKFSFSMAANSVPVGTYPEYFQPIPEGGGAMNDPGTFLNIKVQPAVYGSAYYAQSGYPTFTTGQQAPTSVYLEYTNTGNAPWYDNSSVGSAPSGTLPVHLSTSHPINRGSGFASGWPTANRPAATFSAVYESDGVTLAPNQHVVQPGEIAKFSFNMAANSVPVGTYPEYFQPIVEGGSSMNDPGTFLTVTVH
jgi:hypothetical protein